MHYSHKETEVLTFSFFLQFFVAELELLNLKYRHVNYNLKCEEYDNVITEDHWDSLLWNTVPPSPHIPTVHLCVHVQTIFIDSSVKKKKKQWSGKFNLNMLQGQARQNILNLIKSKSFNKLSRFSKCNYQNSSFNIPQAIYPTRQAECKPKSPRCCNRLLSTDILTCHSRKSVCD